MASLEIRAILPLDATLAAIRAATADMILVVIGPELPAIDRAMLVAALAPLAIECAPERRLCALDLAATANPGDVRAAAAFLASAGSTTGQVLAIV